MAMFKCSGALFNGTIIINTTAGATVTATTSGTTRAFTAVANASGVATIRVKKRGTYAIASTGTTRIGHATVSTNTPVTAYYIWQKWNSQEYYSQTSYSVASNTTIWTGQPRYGYSNATSYTFDSSTGNYTLSGGYVVDCAASSPYNYVYYCHSDCYATQLSSDGSNVAKNILHNDAAYSQDAYVYASKGSSNLRVYTASSGATVYGSSMSYIKGSTQYANATSTSLSTYPTNGRYSTDGYWYIAA